MLPHKYSFKFVSKKRISEIRNTSGNTEIIKNSTEADSFSDDKKRSFLKLATLTGFGLIASQLIPKKAEALILGSTPSSNVVGMKNVANQKINPATEETVATLATEATLSSVATEATLANVATEATLTNIKTNSDKFKFDGNNLLTSSTISGVVAVKDANNTTVSPSTEESAILLRRILKQVDSLSVVDSLQRQKITVDTITSGAVLTAVTTVFNTTAIGGVDGRYLYTDTARNAYANGTRSNLTFS